MHVDLPYTILHPMICDADFRHPSTIHGMGHSLRVSIFASMIGEKTGYVREGRIASVGALFHDLERNNDGDDAVHGYFAAYSAVPRFLDSIYSLGFDDKEVDEMRCAIEWHSLQEELPIDHPFGVATWILKDADALDRIRIKALDTRFLRFVESVELLSTVQAFYLDLIDCIVKLCPNEKQIDETADVIRRWMDDDTGYQTLVTRLDQYPDNTVQTIVQKLESPSLYDMVLNKDC